MREWHSTSKARKGRFLPRSIILLSERPSSKHRCQRPVQAVHYLAQAGPGLLRKVNNRTRETTEEKVFMLDLDLFMDSKIELGQAVPALNIVHENAGSLFRAALTDTLSDAMEPQKA